MKDKYVLLGSIGGALGLGLVYYAFSSRKKKVVDGKPASQDATTVDVDQDSDDDSFFYNPWVQASSLRTSRTLGGRR